ncbi:MAG: VWA domain-containing protein [Bacteroidota bacterium]
MQFANKEFLFLLLLVPAILVWYFYRHKNNLSSIKYSSIDNFIPQKSLKEKLVHFPFIFKIFSIALLIIALARPQSVSQGENIYTEGIDIILAIDVSGSMLAEDLRPNRIEAAKNVADNFISGRVSDRIGLVVFSGESFTQCPLTIDYGVLKNLLKNLQTGMIEDGTAIGLGLTNAVARLKNSTAKSKVIILLTDGVNNKGEIDPITASQIAQSFDIKVYTVGVGTIGQAPYPFNTPFGKQYQMIPVEVDDEMLRKIASQTGGKYFRATNNKSLKNIYAEIDKLEKTKVEIKSYRRTAELYYPFAILSLALIFAEFILSKLFLRRLP